MAGSSSTASLLKVGPWTAMLLAQVPSVAAASRPAPGLSQSLPASQPSAAMLSSSQQVAQRRRASTRSPGASTAGM